MAIDKLNLSSGKWLVANCGKHASGKHCKLVLMAPENQREALLEVMVNHAVESHGHDNNQMLRKELNDLLEKIDI